MPTKGTIRSTFTARTKVRKTVLQDQDTIEAVCLASLGKGNTVLRERYNLHLSDGQLQYRLTRAKMLAGYDKGDGFRKRWRDGRSDFEDLVKAVMPAMRENYDHNILSHLEKPAPKMSTKVAA